MKTLSHGFGWLRRLAFLLLLMGIAGDAMAAKTYTVNEDGTVTDPTTGLIWMRCALGQVWDGMTCTGTASTYTFSRANVLKTTYANQSDWRVPNIRELQTIVDRSVFNPAINSVAFPGTSPSYFWSASVDAGYSGKARDVNFYSGSAVRYDGFKSNTNQVRLVRAGQSFNLLNVSRPTSDYVDHANGTVTHTPTGLMWQRCAFGQTLSPAGRCTGTAGTYTWDQAQQLSSSLAGHTDWRLPTEDELISLVDYNAAASSTILNAQVFPDTPLGSNGYSSDFWSASADAGYLDYAWLVNFGGGFPRDRDPKSNALQVRLVRAATTVAPTTTTSTALRTTTTTTTTASVTTTTVVSTSKTYTDNGDGTVTDPTTGLVWMLCAMGQTWDGITCTGTADAYPWGQANALTGTVFFAGQSDWRVPNIRELQTIVDLSVSYPAINSVAFPGTSPSYFWSVWSATAKSGSSNYAWNVYFDSGGANYFSKSNAFQVRLVRAGQSFNLLDIARPSSDYVDHADGTVTHTPTGLMWQRCAVGQTLSTAGRCTGTAGNFTWDQAKAVSSSLAGHTDWRLPTEDELISLVDYNAANPALNAQVFPDAPLDSNGYSSHFWSASVYGSNAYWWDIDSRSGNTQTSNKSIAFQVRLVRAATTVAPTTTTSTALRTTTTTTTTASVTTTTVVSTSKTYTDNGDGTVTDPTTGLIWMRCAMGQTWDGITCTGTASTYTHDQANGLTGTTTFAGYGDWRLPNIRELQTIVDRSVSNPAIDSVAFPDTRPSNFWSAPVDSGYSSHAWYVDFFSGYASRYGYSKIGGSVQARLVRAGQSFNLLDISRPTSDYVDHADGTVTHTPTGLMWQRCAVGQTLSAERCTDTAGDYTWEQATQLSSSLGGYTDWRLPTEDELISLVDYNAATIPAINAQIFPDTSASNFWSASANSDFSSNAWYVSFSNGYANGYGYKSSYYQARLVRVDTLVTTSTTTTTISTVTTTTTTTQSPVGLTLSLSTGWNLLGNGWNQSLPVASVFGDAARITTVWKWDVAKIGWQFYSPTITAQDLQAYAAGKGYGVLSEISAGEGFWVNVNRSFTVVLPTTVPITGSGFQAGKAYALKNGWNLVAVGVAQSASEFNSVLSILPPVAGVVPQNLTTLWAWDNPQTKWYFYSPQLDAKGGTALTDYIASKGYLDFTAANRLLWPGTGFWVNKP